MGDDELRLSALWIGESLASLAGLSGKLCVVLDLGDASLFPLLQNNKLLRICIETWTGTQPERLASLLLVNAPFSFSAAAWPLVQRRLSVRTQRKVHIMASSREALPFIDACMLPGNLGGTGPRLDASDLVVFPAPKPDAGGPRSNAPDAQVSPLPDLLSTLALELQRAMLHADAVERETLEYNASMRARLSRPTASHDAAMSAEELELAAQLKVLLDERDAYARAVHFARNFLEIEAAEENLVKTRLEAEISALKQTNVILSDELEVALGADGRLFAAADNGKAVV
jgi:hypothetical protein